MAQQIKKKYIDGVIFTEIQGNIDAAVLVEKNRAEAAEAQALIDAKAYADVKKSEAISDAHAYADQVKNDLLGGAGAAYDTLKELEVLLQNEESAIVALTQVVGDNLQTAKDYADAAVLVEKNRAEGVEALKADITYVDGQLYGLGSVKADIIYVDAQDELKLQEAKDYADAQIAAIPAADLTPYLKHDGSVPMSGSLNAGNFPIVNLPQASGVGQAVEFGQYADAMAVKADTSYVDAVASGLQASVDGLQFQVDGLQGQIDLINGTTWRTEKIVLGAGDLVSKNLLSTPSVGSVFLFVDAIPMCEGVDFTVDGYTLTFAGDLVSGPMALEAGDVLLVKYLSY
jgi:hypothetical protein